MNTVAVNEALVHHWAAKGMHISGFNPGLIASGIRDSLHGGGCCGGCLEGCIGLFNPSAETYAVRSILPLFTAPELDTNKGVCFGQSGKAILPAPEFNDASVVAAWIDAADKLVAKADAAGAATAGGAK